MGADTTSFAPGTIIGDKYRVDRVIGMGGMAVVLAATHVELGEQRAIKLLLPEVLQHEKGEELRERFLREGRANVKLKSRHVATVHDVGRTASGEPFLVMELFVGNDLRAEIAKTGRLPIRRAVRLILQALEALAEAHAAGIIHRDMKPGNLFITRDDAGEDAIKVLDFGISKLTEGVAREMTKTASVLGTPHYMSPEQLRDTKNVDARADIWSVGVILYFATTGVLPYDGDTIPALCSAVFETDAEPPRQLCSDIPPALETVIMRCLQKDRERRYATVAQLAAALLPFAPDESEASLKRICHHLSLDPDLVRDGAASDVQPTLRRASVSSVPPTEQQMPMTTPFPDEHREAAAASSARASSVDAAQGTLSSVGTDVTQERGGTSTLAVVGAALAIGVAATGGFFAMRGGDGSAVPAASDNSASESPGASTTPEHDRSPDAAATSDPPASSGADAASSVAGEVESDAVSEASSEAVPARPPPRARRRARTVRAPVPPPPPRSPQPPPPRRHDPFGDGRD